jgi:hypothetical protein
MLAPSAGCGSSSSAPDTSRAGSPEQDASMSGTMGPGAGADGATATEASSSPPDGGSPVATLDAGSGADAALPPLTLWSGTPVSIPLLVRQPYFSLWQNADSVAGTWASFWQGAIKALTGIATVDGKAYVLMGKPDAPTTLMTQSSLSLSPTRTFVTLGAAGINVTLEFISPVETTDLSRQSMPLGYIRAQAVSTDGGSHAVNLYFDITGEWAHGDSTVPVVWGRESVPAAQGSVVALHIQANGPTPLAETSDYPEWGTAFLATATDPRVTSSIGSSTVVRMQGASGPLDGSVDTNMPRAIDDDWPVLGLSFDLGAVKATPTTPAVVIVGQARDPAVSYLGTAVPPLWKSYWATWEAMAASALDDAEAARSRADTLDRLMSADALAVGGQDYLAICDLALRQAFGGTELVGTKAKPWLFLKEISSDGNVSTVDVVYPASPAFLYAAPQMMPLMLEPLLEYAETGGWPKTFAEHDLGSSYPNAAGHNNGNEEDMPVEESANMLLMTAGVLKTSSPSVGSAFATTHYKILKQWGDYLVANALDPGNQNQTDDFTGFIAHSVNLALKGILAVGAMGSIAQAAGNTADAAMYTQQSKTMIASWATKAQDGTHLRLAYDQPGTWSLKYNGFYDRYLGLNLIPASVIAEETAFYKTVEQSFGFPLDSRHATVGMSPYTKGDWEMFTAATTGDAALRTSIIKDVYKFVTQSPTRVPFSDWYATDTGRVQGFQARPVIGGMFALMLVEGHGLH